MDSDRKLQNMPLMIAYIQTHLDSTCLKQSVLWKQSLCKRGEKTLYTEKETMFSHLQRHTVSQTLMPSMLKQWKNPKHYTSAFQYLSQMVLAALDSCNKKTKDINLLHNCNNKIICHLEHVIYFLCFICRINVSSCIKVLWNICGAVLCQWKPLLE